MNWDYLITYRYVNKSYTLKERCHTLAQLYDFINYKISEYTDIVIVGIEKIPGSKEMDRFYPVGHRSDDCRAELERSKANELN